MKKINPKQLGLLFLGVFISVFLLSCTFIMDASGRQSSLSFIQWGNSQYIVLLITLFLIGIICGALVISLTKMTRFQSVVLMSLGAGILTLFVYAVVTLCANVAYILSPNTYHYAWSGVMGYFGDAFFIIIVVMVAYGIFILPGFFLGGFIPVVIKKIRRSGEKRLSS